MKVIKIESTPTTKKMIGNIVQGLQKQKPDASYVGYSVMLTKKSKFSRLLTDENNGELRNVSLLDIDLTSLFHTVRAVVGNKTGNILIEEKPFWMKTEKALKRVQDFLSQLQPESHPGSVTSKFPEEIGKSSKLVKSTEYFEGSRIENYIHGSNDTLSFEVAEAYKTL